MYFGGKNGSGVYQTIINNFPVHKKYAEICLGSGAVMRHKKPAAVNIGIEIDHAVINRFNASITSAVPGCEVFCDSAISWLKTSTFPDKDTLIYADPPYPKLSRRSAKDVYSYEMTDEDHELLLNLLLSTRALVAISTYKNPLYEKMLKDWRLVKFSAQTRQGIATEYLYMNYPPPLALHDYSFLGKNNTERQRIHRKIKRHVERLYKLPTYERQAIIEAIRSCADKTSFPVPEAKIKPTM